MKNQRNTICKCSHDVTSHKKTTFTRTNCNECDCHSCDITSRSSNLIIICFMVTCIIALPLMTFDAYLTYDVLDTETDHLLNLSMSEFAFAMTVLTTVCIILSITAIYNSYISLKRINKN